jgi:hypothetical protein
MEGLVEITPGYAYKALTLAATKNTLKTQTRAQKMPVISV